MRWGEATGAMNLCLRVISGADKPFDYRCSSDVVIGRSQTADLCIPRDRFLSKRHARVFEDTGAWYVEDLGSRNTTLLNGQPVDERIQVFEGDVIRLSDCHMEVTFVPVPRSDDNTAVYRAAATVLQQTDSKERLQETPGDPSLKRYVERLALLNEIHRALANQMSRDELFGTNLGRDHRQLEWSAARLRAWSSRQVLERRHRHRRLRARANGDNTVRGLRPSQRHRSAGYGAL